MSFYWGDAERINKRNMGKGLYRKYMEEYKAGKRRAIYPMPWNLDGEYNAGYGLLLTPNFKKIKIFKCSLCRYWDCPDDFEPERPRQCPQRWSPEAVVEFNMVEARRNDTGCMQGNPLKDYWKEMFSEIRLHEDGSIWIYHNKDSLKMLQKIYYRSERIFPVIMDGR